MKFKLLSTVLIGFGLCFSLPVMGQHRIGPKFGSIDWEKQTVNISGADIEYKKGSPPPIGVSYGYIFFDSFYAGGEFIYEALDSTTGLYSISNDINVYRINAMLNYYFLKNDFIKPYAGIGYGYTEMGIHAAESAELHGYSAMGIIGMDLKFNKLMALNFEYRRAYLSIDDQSNNQLKVHNNEFFIGIQFYFGK